MFVLLTSLWLRSRFPVFRPSILEKLQQMTDTVTEKLSVASGIYDVTSVICNGYTYVLHVELSAFDLTVFFFFFFFCKSHVFFR